jgi:hypothetical protein
LPHIARLIGGVEPLGGPAEASIPYV